MAIWLVINSDMIKAATRCHQRDSADTQLKNSASQIYTGVLLQHCPSFLLLPFGFLLAFQKTRAPLLAATLQAK